MNDEIHAVTGAFGFSGRYIAEALLERGVKVRTLTNSPNRESPLQVKIDVHGYHWDEPDKLVDALRGVDVLYNTYWVRFNHRTFKHQSAVDNTLALFEAAKKAGVKRVIHTSITNPSEDSELEYFHGKAVLERALIESGLSYAILRPAVLFGPEDILVNNIAWSLRKLPVFGVFGDGSYRLQPIHVADFAALAVKEAFSAEDRVIEAIGPETFTYRELARRLGEIIGKPRPIIGVPPALGFAVGWVLGKLVGDVLITWDEVKGLMADLLYVDAPAAGETRLTAWAAENSETLGKRYASELARRLDRGRAYGAATAAA